MEEVARDTNLRITRLELGPFGTNSYVVVCNSTNESMVVDAPGEVEKIIDALTGTSPRYIVITHNHRDHTGALDGLKERLNVPVAMNPVDARKAGIVPDIELNDHSMIKLGKLDIEVLHTPGHTLGSISLLVGNYLLAGDTVFPGGPGKTGSPAAFRQIVDTITMRILVLQDNTSIYPGHGLPTKVADVKKEIAMFNSRPHAPDLCGDVLWLSS